MDKKTQLLTGTECERDYKKRHSWEKIGVTTNKAGIRFLIWRCTQCKKCVSEPLDFIQLSALSESDRDSLLTVEEPE